MEKKLLKALKTYEEFFEIEASAFQEKIRYFKSNVENVSYLPLRERFEIRFHYLNAYFEVGAYSEYLKHADSLIEGVIEHNIFRIHNKDVFEHLLFRKAACLYNTMQHVESIRILEQLKRIYPETEKHGILLAKAHRRKLQRERLSFKALCIFLYFFAGFIIASKIFVIDGFFPEYKTLTQNIWIFVFMLSTVLLGINNLAIYFQSNRLVKNT